MRNIVAAVFLTLGVFLGFAASAETTITGAGASFPYPVYIKWASEYKMETGTEVNYQSIGSSGGIVQIKNKSVNFGASDAPLGKEELDEFGLIQFPMVIGGVVPVVNVKGVNPGQLRLSPSALADIFLGKITKWNDEAIVALNPELQLPDQDIRVMVRADGSGTTWIFTDYLAKVSSEWMQGPGTGKRVSWPEKAGQGKGNEGIAAKLLSVPGSIGYVEFSYALDHRLNYISLQNKSGAFVAPTMDSFQAAAASADWSEKDGFGVVLTNQPGEYSWPITGASFILMHKEQEDEETAREMLKFFEYCYKQGGSSAKKLHYVPVPGKVVKLIETAWEKDVSAKGSAIWP